MTARFSKHKDVPLNNINVAQRYHVNFFGIG